MKYLMLSIAIVSEVIGTTAMKQSDGFTKPLWIVVTAVAYGMAFYFLAQTLKEIPIGIAYAVWSGVGIVLISIVAWIFQGQRLDLPAIAGIALIIAGVVIMNAFSKVSPH
tara:strand:+ start:4046 stop:4375 length:330 start_codon:yes stop_codon:yes gene_type:complete